MARKSSPYFSTCCSNISCTDCSIVSSNRAKYIFNVRGEPRIEQNSNSRSHRKSVCRRNSFCIEDLQATLYALFRLVQYSAGVLSDIPTHEVYFYCSEALPMFLALLVLIITHPGRYLIGPESEYPRKSRQQKREEAREKKAAK
jgi:hypothetical protein